MDAPGRLGDWHHIQHHRQRFNIFDEYQNTYYPTIYGVPSRILTQSGQASVADHASIFQANNRQAATLANDALGSYTGDGLVCGDLCPATLAVELQNMGLENLTSCTITAYDTTLNASTDWMGNLSPTRSPRTVGEASFSATPTSHLKSLLQTATTPTLPQVRWHCLQRRPPTFRCV